MKTMKIIPISLMASLFLGNFATASVLKLSTENAAAVLRALEAADGGPEAALVLQQLTFNELDGNKATAKLMDLVTKATHTKHFKIEVTKCDRATLECTIEAIEQK
jgi:hypothetical protein